MRLITKSLCLLFVIALGIVGATRNGEATSEYTIVDLGTLGGTIVRPYDMNSGGQVTGEAYVPGNVDSHAFVYSGGLLQDLGTLGGMRSIGTAINAAGQVTGTAATSFPGASHAFRFS